jgi:RimJ/RimL family protein N-acetyltransferase
MLCDPEVMRFYPRPMSRGEAEHWILRNQRRYVDEGCGYWLALDRATGRPVGQAGVTIHEVGDELLPGLGYMLLPPYQRRGLATEAAGACCHYVLENLGRNAAFALIRPDNVPSMRVAERIGMRQTGAAIHAGMPHTVWSRSRFSIATCDARCGI